MSLVKFNCPSCQFELASPAHQARAGVKCPKCETGFVPDRVEIVHGREAKDFAPDHKRVKTRAESVSAVGKLCALIGGIVLLLAILMRFSDGSNGFELFYWSAGFLAAAFWLTLLAQLLHIRAALEKAGGPAA